MTNPLLYLCGFASGALREKVLAVRLPRRRFLPQFQDTLSLSPMVQPLLQQQPVGGEHRIDQRCGECAPSDGSEVSVGCDRSVELFSRASNSCRDARAVAEKGLLGKLAWAGSDLENAATDAECDAAVAPNASLNNEVFTELVWAGAPLIGDRAGRVGHADLAARRLELAPRELARLVRCPRDCRG